MSDKDNFVIYKLTKKIYSCLIYIIDKYLCAVFLIFFTERKEIHVCDAKYQFSGMCGNDGVRDCYDAVKELYLEGRSKMPLHCSSCENDATNHICTCQIMC